jgi:hypothetical protein
MFRSPIDSWIGHFQSTNFELHTYSSVIGWFRRQASFCSCKTKIEVSCWLHSPNKYNPYIRKRALWSRNVAFHHIKRALTDIFHTHLWQWKTGLSGVGFHLSICESVKQAKSCGVTLIHLWQYKRGLSVVWSYLSISDTVKRTTLLCGVTLV